MFNDIFKVRSALLHGIPDLQILVVGDLMLDCYLSGDCERVSQEAPVPVIRLRRKSSSLGGAANLAHNLSKLGVKVHLAGLIGQDRNGEALIEACEQAGINSDWILKSEDAVTVTKTRLLAGDHQIARFDEEVKRPIPDEEATNLLDKVARRDISFDAVIISDYDKGVCTPYLCQRIIRFFQSREIPVFVDPKGTDFRKYKGATAVKPNQPEMALISQTEGWHSEDLVDSARQLRQLLDLQFVALTLGACGIALVTEESVDRFATAANEVFDVSGAGDAVIAGLVAGFAAGLDLRDAVILGNLAAGQVTSKVGCVPVERAELLLAVQMQTRSTGSAKLFTLDELVQVSDAWKTENQKVAFTNGCFDLLHVGHVRLLEDSAARSDRLIVAINSDESVTRLKGKGRPIMNESERIEVLSSLQCVDAVVVFKGDSPVPCLESIRPDLLVKGGDYEMDQVEGAEFVQSYGGEVLLIPLVKTKGNSLGSHDFRNL